MDRRYQVFVSSTYTDLKEERQGIIRVLMQMDCIPAGMELFPAADEAQWTFICRVIDQSDYYLLVVGGRYGALVNDEDISYTEKEFDYAVSQGLKVVALLHENPDLISVGKSDVDPALRKKLDAFRQKVMTNRLVSFWSSSADLPGKVALGLIQAQKLFPKAGWVRGDKVANETLLAELNDIRKENDRLKVINDELRAQIGESVDAIVDLDDKVAITMAVDPSRRVMTDGLVVMPPNKASAALEISLREIFDLIGDRLMEHQKEPHVSLFLDSELGKRAGASAHFRILPSIFDMIRLRLKVLGLIDYYVDEANKVLVWKLTAHGERLLCKMRAGGPVSGDTPSSADRRPASTSSA